VVTFALSALIDITKIAKVSVSQLASIAKHITLKMEHVLHVMMDFLLLRMLACPSLIASYLPLLKL
jgi:hypothetical protein